MSVATGGLKTLAIHISILNPYEEHFPTDNLSPESQPEEEEPGFLKKVWEKIKDV